MSAITLPTENSIKGVANQGFPIDTEVKPSSIEGAGNGRYAKQDVAPGDVVVQKVLVPMEDISSLLNVEKNVTITFARAEDLEKYISLMEKEGGFSRNDVLKLYEHFMYGFDRKVCCLNESTWTINHAESAEGGLNCVVDFKGAQLPDGRPAYVCRSYGVKSGAELFMDYNRFALPDFYLAYTRRHMYDDVQTATLKAVHGAGAEDLLKGIYGADHARFKPSGIMLPTDNSIKGVANQGFPISTEVAPSSIEGAGNGRYARQDVAPGDVVVQKVLVPMAEISSLLNVEKNVTITFACLADLEKYISLMGSEGGFPRDVVLKLYEHFMYGFDRKVCCLNVSTWTINHAEIAKDGLNWVVDFKDAQLPDGRPAYVCRSYGIKSGAELFMDYNRFALPDFYLAFARRHSFEDVQTVTLKAVYGAGAEDALKGIYGADHPRFQPSAIMLPTDNSINGVANQGFPISTEVKPSSIEGAGNGRYSKQDVAPGEVVVQKVLVPMAEISSLLNVEKDVTITFACLADLEKYIALMGTEGGFARDVVLKLYEHFVYGFDRKVCCLNVSTWTINHAEKVEGGLNCVVDFKGARLPDGRPAYVCRSYGVKSGAELFMDYNRFALPDFYLAFAKQHGFDDVQTVTLKAVYGSGAEDLLKGIYGANHARFN